MITINTQRFVQTLISMQEMVTLKCVQPGLWDYGQFKSILKQVIKISMILINQQINGTNVVFTTFETAVLIFLMAASLVISIMLYLSWTGMVCHSWMALDLSSLITLTKQIFHPSISNLWAKRLMLVIFVSTMLIDCKLKWWLLQEL